MKIQVITVDNNKVVIPAGILADGDWFRCEKCGYTVRKLVLGNYATCSECGGRQVRI